MVLVFIRLSFRLNEPFDVKHRISVKLSFQLKFHMFFKQLDHFLGQISTIPYLPFLGSIELYTPIALNSLD